MSSNKDLEAIFSAKNIDQDCNKIAELMQPIKRNIFELIDAGLYKQSIDLFMELMTVMSHHFIADEHWNYFDDLYAPDYECIDIFNRYSDLINQGKLPKEASQYLYDNMQKIAQLESVQDYGVPSVEQYIRKFEELAK